MNRRLALCAAPVILLIALRAWNGIAKAEERHGRYTASQILDRAEFLCGQLAPSDGRVRLSADPITVPRPHRTPQRFWHVDCTDALGREVTFLRWDAETGDIICMSHWCRLPDGAASALLDARGAIAASHFVVAALSPYAGERFWRLAAPAKAAPYAWQVRWRSRNREAIVSLDRAGQMRSVEFVPCSCCVSSHLLREGNHTLQ